MKLVGQISGGLSSWLAAARAHEQYPNAEHTYLFADTLVEDEDLYRFLVEIMAVLHGHSVDSVADLALRTRAIPPYESSKLEERKAALKGLRADTVARLPRLAWIADGRTPHEVFKDQRFLGNSKKDPCSKILKRELLHRWLVEHCDPADTLVYTGLGWWEEHRQIELAERKAAIGWTYVAPLCDRPYITHPEMEERAQAAGIEVPRLYGMGFKHNNCGGACVKAGIGQWAHLYKMRPAVFDKWEREELRIRLHLGKNVAMLEDRRGGTRKPMPLYQLRARLEGRDAPLDPIEQNDVRGCGCAIDYSDEEEVTTEP